MCGGCGLCVSVCCVCMCQCVVSVCVSVLCLYVWHIITCLVSNSASADHATSVRDKSQARGLSKQPLRSQYPATGADAHRAVWQCVYCASVSGSYAPWWKGMCTIV